MDQTFNNAVQRNSVPFRHDIVGSFLRPQSIKDARIKYAQDELTINGTQFISNTAHTGGQTGQNHQIKPLKVHNIWELLCDLKQISR